MSSLSLALTNLHHRDSTLQRYNHLLYDGRHGGGSGFRHVVLHLNNVGTSSKCRVICIGAKGWDGMGPY